MPWSEWKKFSGTIDMYMGAGTFTVPQGATAVLVIPDGVSQSTITITNLELEQTITGAGFIKKYVANDGGGTIVTTNYNTYLVIVN